MFYEALRGQGLDLGPTLQAVQMLRYGRGEALGLVRNVSERGPYRVHPAFLDGCLQVLGAATLDFSKEAVAHTYLFVGLDRLSLAAEMPAEVWSHARLRNVSGAEGKVLVGDVRILDEAGRVLGEACGVRLARATRESLLRSVAGQTAHWFYEVEWPTKPLAGQRLSAPSAEYMPAPEHLAGRLRPQLAALASEQGLGLYEELQPQLNELSRLYVRTALHQLGWDPGPGEMVTASALADRLRVAAQHRRLFERLLEALAEDGELRRVDGTWEVVSPLRMTRDPERWRGELLARYADCTAELTMLGRCGSHLAEALRGACDPLQLLFPDGSFSAAEGLYQESRFARVYNAATSRRRGGGHRVASAGSHAARP